MSTVTVNNRQLRSIMRKLDRVGSTASKRRAMTKSVLHYQAKIATYPPHSAANVPPGINGYSWYVRGSGTHTITGKVYRTSEDLGPSWATSVSPNGNRGRIFNNASYGDYVQDKDKQTNFHKTRGWENTEDSLTAATPKIVGFFKAEHDEALRKP